MEEDMVVFPAYRKDPEEELILVKVFRDGRIYLTKDPEPYAPAASHYYWTVHNFLFVTPGEEISLGNASIRLSEDGKTLTVQNLPNEFAPDYPEVVSFSRALLVEGKKKLMDQ